MVVMVIGLRGLQGPSFAPAGEITDFDFGFAINRESEGIRISIRLLVRRGDMLENGIDFREFFLRLHLLCFFRR